MKKTLFLFLLISSFTAFSQSYDSSKSEIHKLSNKIDSLSYGFGVSIGQNFKMSDVFDLNLDAIKKGLADALDTTNKDSDQFLINEIEIQTIIETYFDKKNQAKNNELQKEYEDVITANKQFLEENKAKKGVVTTASGLQYIVIKKGKGKKPNPENTVKTHYHGTFIDDTVFDSSLERGDPVEFPVMSVIPGWQEVLQLMPVGSKYKVFIPQELAYGEREAGRIPAFSILIFEIELLEITK